MKFYQNLVETVGLCAVENKEPINNLLKKFGFTDFEAIYATKFNRYVVKISDGKYLFDLDLQTNQKLQVLTKKPMYYKRQFLQ